MLQIIRNGSANFTMRESYSLFYGTCLTFCHKRAITAKDTEYVLIKQGLKLGIFIHDRGDEELILARLEVSLYTYFSSLCTVQIFITVINYISS
jgi:hypothetical protein